MPERYAKSIKVLVRQFAENVNLDVILSEALRVLPETELLKPLSNLLHRARALAVSRSDGMLGSIPEAARIAQMPLCEMIAIP